MIAEDVATLNGLETSDLILDSIESRIDWHEEGTAATPLETVIQVQR